MALRTRMWLRWRLGLCCFCRGPIALLQLYRLHRGRAGRSFPAHLRCELEHQRNLRDIDELHRNLVALRRADPAGDAGEIAARAVAADLWPWRRA